MRRRSAIELLGGGAAAVLLPGCPGERARRSGGAEPGTCELYPEQTEGPYYVDTDLVRSDITDGKNGVPLALAITVVDESCVAIPGAIVDVWHADAAGAYSGVEGNTETFLRGLQPVDALGRATFQTVFPGWYTGRTTHVHFMVHFTNGAEVTSQLYFPEAINDAVYAMPMYRGTKPTPSARDSIFDGAPLLAVTGTVHGGFVATMQVTVRVPPPIPVLPT